MKVENKNCSILLHLLVSEPGVAIKLVNFKKKLNLTEKKFRNT